MSQQKRNLLMKSRLLHRFRENNPSMTNTSKLLNENEVKNIQAPLVKKSKQEYLDRHDIQCNSGDNYRNPFASSCIIPLPGAIPDTWVGNSGEPSLIRKRNERERERVRCVNEGYARLRRHLPLSLNNRRISKVETLRYAIAYIEYLQELIQFADTMQQSCADGSRHYFREYTFPH